VKIICYELTMPGRNTWNGKWSGEGRLYAIIRRYKSQKAEKRARSILEYDAYYYHWSDGWTAKVSVRQVNFADARKLRRKSRGFLSYDWMIDSIEQDRRIIAPSERKNEG